MSEGIASISNIKKSVDYERRLRKAGYVLITILAASAVIFLAISILAILNEGVPKFIATVLKINGFYYSIALLLIFSAYLLRYPKWEMYMKRLGVKIQRRKNFWIYLSMYSMDITPGRWGRAIVSYTINRLTGVKFGRTFPAIVTDIFTDFLGFVIICLFFSFLVHQYLLESVIISLILMLPFVFLYHRGPFTFIKRKLSRFSRLRSFFEVGDLYFKNNKRLGGDVYWYSLLYTVPSMFLNALSLYFIILSFGVSLPPIYIPAIIFVFTSSLLLGMITGIPANLGVTDAVLLGFLVAFFGSAGVDFGVASVITIFSRMANVWFVELFGFIALLHTMKYWHKKK